jgi:hypothetical protein
MRKASLMFLIPLMVILGIMVSCGGDRAVPFTGSYVIDHTNADLEAIHDTYVDEAQDIIKLHYAHTSYGSQLTTGLTRIEAADPAYNVEIGYMDLPSANDALNIFDGQESETGITPDLYWQTAAGMEYTRAVLDNNSGINVSMWCWATELDTCTEEQVQAYLDSLAVLEEEYPDVTFIYMTGNAQSDGAEGYNRYLRNEQIRQYCINNEKVLYDFADLDAWWFNPSTGQWEYSTYNYSGMDIPKEHAMYHGDEAGHTTYESCEVKGAAVWWLMAILAGWE